MGRLGAVLVALATLVCAKDGALDKEVAAILDELRTKVRESRPPRMSEKLFAEWERKREELRAAAAARVEALLAAHGPGGSGPRRDIAPAADALLSRYLAPPGDKAWDLTARLVRIEPQRETCWTLFDLLFEHIEREHLGEDPPWTSVRNWARGLRGRLPGQAAFALELFCGRVSFETGDERATKLAAELVINGDGVPAGAKKAAHRLRSRVSLLRGGLEAPGFRIGKIGGGGEWTLDHYRGRALLLHFWYLDKEDYGLVRILEDCREQIPKTELAILSVPYGGDADLETLAVDIAGDTEWDVAAPGEVNPQVAAAYGAQAISALFLIAPDGKVLASSWREHDAADRVRRYVRDAMGAPLGQTLGTIGKAPWAAFRQFWHGLVARNRTRFDDETWALARRAGPRALWALALAADQDPPGGPMEGQDLHGRLVVAARTSAWEEVLKAAKRPSDDACLALVDALYDLGLHAETLRAPLERVATRARPWETTAMALRALQFQDTNDSPRPLRRLLRHKTWQVRLALADALGAYRHRHAIDILIELVGDKRLRVRARAADRLEMLTGETFGTSQRRWTKWRREQGEQVRLKPREVSRFKPFTRPDRKYAFKDYYGLQIASNRVAFVLDKSESMFYGLFDGVVEEMRAHLESSGPTTRFNVIEFDAKPRAWNQELVPANPANVNDAVAFLNRAKPYGPTNVIDSLRLAVETPDLDAIVLLSDGLPNRGEPKAPDGILRAVETENRHLRIAIHTVLLLEGRPFPHDGPRGDEIPPLDDQERARRRKLRDVAPRLELGAFLKALADLNDGTFGVGFADAWLPPPGATFRNTSDK